MEFIWMGALTKPEVIALLRNRGCTINNVHELNKIMEEIGVLVRSESQWLITEEAVKYTSSNSQVDEAIWCPSVVGAIHDFLTKQHMVKEGI